jgi:hypothetical protein
VIAEVNASGLEVVRSGSIEMHSVIDLVRGEYLTGTVSLMAAVTGTPPPRLSADSSGFPRLGSRSAGPFLDDLPAGSTYESTGRPNGFRTLQTKVDTGQRAGSASFSYNPAWGRYWEMTDGRCMLTRRTRLQYMRCNGVGGSTC